MSDLNHNLQSLLWISSGLCSYFCAFVSCLESQKVLTCNIFGILHKLISKKCITSQGGLLTILGQFMNYRRPKNTSRWRWSLLVRAIYESLIYEILKALLLHVWDYSNILQSVNMSDLSHNHTLSSEFLQDYVVIFVFFLILKLWKVLTCNIYNKLHKVFWKKLTTSERGLLLILGQFFVFRRLKHPSEWNGRK